MHLLWLRTEDERRMLAVCHPSSPINSEHVYDSLYLQISHLLVAGRFSARQHNYRFLHSIREPIAALAHLP
jgi:hypothetical protein